MSRAAKQCREWILEEFPGTRISRKSCRDTAGGSVSQHSSYAYGEYDANALDIMGDVSGSTWDENVARIQQVVDSLEPYRNEWSIRIILWQVPDHFGHAHIDFWPTCLEHKWCGRDVTPRWETATNTTISSRDPDPENGDYNGPEETDMEPDVWAKPAWDWAIANGLMSDQSVPHDPVDKQEMAVFFHRYWNNIDKTGDGTHTHPVIVDMPGTRVTTNTGGNQ